MIDTYNARHDEMYYPASEGDAAARIASQDEWISYWQAREGAAIALEFMDKAAEAAAELTAAQSVRSLYVDALAAIVNPPAPEPAPSGPTEDEQEAAIAALVAQELGLGTNAPGGSE